MTTFEETIDLGRLERGLELEGQRVGDGRWLVEGGSEPHWVDLRTPEYPRCDCGDYVWREVTCKHILAARLREGDLAVVGAVGRLVTALRERGGGGGGANRIATVRQTASMNVRTVLTRLACRARFP